MYPIAFRELFARCLTDIYLICIKYLTDKCTRTFVLQVNKLQIKTNNRYQLFVLLLFVLNFEQIFNNLSVELAVL